MHLTQSAQSVLGCKFFNTAFLKTPTLCHTKTKWKQRWRRCEQTRTIHQSMAGKYHTQAT
jgi:hypothetical protein